MVHEHKVHAPKHLRFAILTASDSRTKENDTTGKLISDSLKEAEHHVVHHEIVRDDFDLIKRTILELAEDVDVVITNGGTGISKKDVTTESVSTLIDKELDGFGELFRMLSYQEIGSAALMSRALAGAFGNKIIICLPGSPNAVELAMKELILPEIGHMIWEVRR